MKSQTQSSTVENTVEEVRTPATETENKKAVSTETKKAVKKVALPEPTLGYSKEMGCYTMTLPVGATYLGKVLTEPLTISRRTYNKVYGQKGCCSD